MSIIAHLENELMRNHDFESLQIKAFAGTELRGVAQVKLYPELEKGLIFLPVFANQIMGEKINFHVESNEMDKVLGIEIETEFAADAIVGSFDYPITMKAIPEIPESFFLSQNFPNPFNPVTQINYQLPEDSFVDLKIYNVRGQEVATLVSGMVNAGYQSVIWQGKDNQGVIQPTGIYFVKMDSDLYQKTRKIVLLK